MSLLRAALCCLAVGAVNGAPLFELNLGQSEPGVRYTAREGRWVLLLLRDGDTAVASEAGRIAWRLLGANPETEFVPSERSATHRSYLRGGDRAKWIHDAPLFGRVVRRNAYAGIDVAYHASPAGAVEYDYVLRPGADPRTIRLRFDDGVSLQILADGSLLARRGGFSVRHKSPVAFTESNGARTPVAVRFVRRGENEIGFAVGEYDNRRVLTIDPELVIERSGGSGDDDVISSPPYLIGSTTSADLPASPPRTPRGRDVWFRHVGIDAAPIREYVVGGSGDDRPLALATGRGRIYIVGETTSRDLPANSFQTVYGGGERDGFILSLPMTFQSGEQPVLLSYFGGAGADRIKSVRFGPGRFVFAGETDSADLPGAAIRGQSPRGGVDAFLAEDPMRTVNAIGVEGLTLIGGAGDDFVGGLDITTEVRSGVPFPIINLLGETTSRDFPQRGGERRELAGESDAYWVEYDAGAMRASRLHGGNGRDRFAALLPFLDGKTAFAGDSTSNDLPGATASGGRDLWLAFFDGGWGANVLVGGSGDETLTAALLNQEVVSMGGATTSQNLRQVEPQQAKFGGGESDGILVRVRADGVVTMASYLGGDGRDAVTSICVCEPARTFLSATGGIARLRKIGISGTTNSKNWGEAAGGADTFFTQVLLAAEPSVRPFNMARGILTPLTLDLGLTGTEAKLEVVGGQAAQLTTTPVVGTGAASVRRLWEEVWLYPTADTGDAEIRVETESTGPFLVQARIGKYRVNARPSSPGALVYTFATDFFGEGFAFQSFLSSNQIGLHEGDPAWRVELLTPETVGFEAPEATSATSYVFPFTGSFANLVLRLRPIRPGSFRLRVRLLNDAVEPVEVSGEVQARYPALSIPQAALVGTPREAAIGVTTGLDLTGDIRVTSLAPEVIGLSLRPQDPPVQELALPTSGSTLHRFFVHAIARSGGATIRVAGAGMATAEVPLRVHVPVIGLAPVVFPVLNAGATQQGSVDVFSYDPERMQTGIGPLPAISGPIPLRLADPSVARLSAQELARPGPFSVTGLREGVTELVLGAVGDIGVLPSAERSEVRVAPVAGIGDSFTVGASLRTTVNVALPFTPQQVAAGVKITSGDPSKLLFRASTASGPTAQLTIPSLTIPRIDNLSLHGREATGDVILQIEAADGASHQVRVQVQPVALLFGASVLEVPRSNSESMEIGYHPIDPATGAPGAPQFWDGIGTPPLRFRTESGAEPSLREVAARVPGRRTVEIAAAPGRTRVAIVQPEGFFAAPAAGGAITVVGEPRRIFSVLRTVMGQGTQQLLLFSAPSGKRITLRSSDPSKVVISNDRNRVGSGELVLGAQPGDGGFHYLQALEGTGEVQVEADIEGEDKQVLPVTVVPIVARWIGGTRPSALSAGMTDILLEVRLGLADPYAAVVGSAQPFLELRPGLNQPRIAVRSSDPSVLRLAQDSVVVDAVTSSVTVRAEAVGAGSAELVLEPTGFIQTANRSRMVVLVAPSRLAITVQGGAIITQHSQATATVQLAGVNPGAGKDIPITLTSSDPSRLLLSIDPRATGAVSTTAIIFAGRATTNFFYLHVLRGDGEVTIEASGAGVQSARMAIALRPAGLALRLDKSVSTPWNVSDGPVRGRVGLAAGNEFPITPRPGIRITGSLRSSVADVASVSPEAFAIDGQNPTAQFEVRPSRGGTTTLRIDAAEESFAPGTPRSVNIDVARTQLDVRPAFRGLPPYGAMLATVGVPEGIVSSTDVTVTIRSTRVRLTETLQSPVASPLRITIPVSKKQYTATFWIHWPGTDLTGDITAEADGYLPRTVPIGTERGVLIMADGDTPFRFAERVLNSNAGQVNLFVLYGIQTQTGFVSGSDLVVSTLGGAVGVEFLGGGTAVRPPDGGVFIAPGNSRTAVPLRFGPPGSATLTLSSPGFDTPSTLQLQIYYSPYVIQPQTARLAKYGTVRVSARWLGQAQERDVPLAVRTPNVNIVSLTPNGFGPPMDTLSLPYVAGTQIRSFVAHAGDVQGSATIRIGDDAILPVQVVPGGLTFAPTEAAVRRVRVGAPIALRVQASLLEPGTLAVGAAYSVGPPSSVQVHATLSTAGVVSSPAGDGIINGGNQSTFLTFTALAPGQVDVRLVQPQGFATPATNTSVRIIVE